MNAPLQNLPIYQALAQAFQAEGVDHQFTLMGDGNMHWSTAMKNLPGMTTTHARHEHCATMMAAGYALATGKVGVSSVTCGPGFTQIMTALTTASRANIPLVVFAGEAPMHAKWYNQWLEQPPFAVASGAHYISAHSPQRMYQYVREAFYIAQHERKPVVIGVPYDLQKQPLPNLGAYQPSSDILPKPEPMPPNPKQADQLAEKLANARCPIVIAGRGAVRSGAAKDIEEMAETAGALLATTLLGRGMFDHNPFSVGVSGGYSRAITHELSPQFDLVVMLGSSANYYTTDGGNLYPNAEFVQVDVAPQGLNGGMQVADLHIRADAGLTAIAVTKKLKELGKTKAAIRTPELAKRIKEEPADINTYSVEPGLLDPRAVIAELDRVIPKNYDSVSGSGHQSYFHTVMRGRPPEKYFAVREFGAIGNSISLAMGVAMARKDGKTVLFEGDGSLLMHIQELEVMQRHGIKMLMCIMNDGAYGAEIHKLRHDGIDDTGAIFGRTDLAAIAKGFGLRGHTITDVSQIEPLFKAYAAQDKAEIWNFQVSDKVVNPTMNRQVRRGHGKM
jgi:thiamine pyrophosphate-dependent acetolactate synthase large subunit-like protein